ncbi:MAG: sigma-54 dependent transcriptional regulator [Pseudomonadota bacterium]
MIIDDDEDLCVALSRSLQESGFCTQSLSNPSELNTVLEKTLFDCAIVDLRFPACSGLSVIPVLRELDPALAIIMLTGHATVQDAVHAFRLGAVDFLEKGLALDEVVRSIQRGLKRTQTARLARLNRSSVDDSFAGIVGRSEAIRSVIAQARDAAKDDAPVLILGETGCGKDLLASAIHSASGRSSGPYLTSVLGARPEELVLGELFGHMKNAFTGAGDSSAGLLKTAHTGTVFLDEIGDVSYHTQVALLRAVENRTFQPIGASTEVSSDFRIISATNCDIESEIENKRFRSDLFYRLSEFLIRIPPLRERLEDFSLLASHFIANLIGSAGQCPILTEQALLKLQQYAWPGNIREFATEIRRAVRRCDGSKISASDVLLGRDSSRLQDECFNPPFREAKEKFQEQYLSFWIKRLDGSVSAVADHTGVHEQTIRRWLRKTRADSEEL